MNEAGRKTTNNAIRRKQGTADKNAPPLAGDVTFIRIPIPPASAMNRDRPISSLIQAQLQHIQHAESARLPREKRDGRRPEDIHTEAEAASYIAAVTKVLHPRGRKKSKIRLSGQT
jgi:hypothetical protein